MGMSVSIDVRDDVDPTAVEEVVRWLHDVDAMFSPYKDDSEITALGLGTLAYDDASELVRDVLRRCELLRVETDGVFDVFAVAAPNGSTLNPCGYVKGWCIEVAAAILERHGARDFCINAGGDVVLRGEAAPGTPWRVGIRHPDLADQLAAVVAGSGRLAIATSALYERGAHIVDPRDGLPAIGPASVTVVGEDLAQVDAYATTAFVLGDVAVAWLEARPGVEGYVIDRDGIARWTSGFARHRAS